MTICADPPLELVSVMTDAVVMTDVWEGIVEMTEGAGLVEAGGGDDEGTVADVLPHHTLVLVDVLELDVIVVGVAVGVKPAGHMA